MASSNMEATALLWCQPGGTYTLVVTNQNNGCIASADVDVFDIPAPLGQIDSVAMPGVSASRMGMLPKRYGRSDAACLHLAGQYEYGHSQ